MKLAARWCLIVVLFFSFVPANYLEASIVEGKPEEYDVNLLGNGTFEEAAEPPRTIASWERWPSTDDIEVVDSPTEPGNRVLKIQSDNIPVQWGVAEAHQVVEAMPNQPFQLAADVFFESTDATLPTLVTVRIDFYDEKFDVGALNYEEAYIAHFSKNIYQPNGDFETVLLNGIAPEGTRYAKVELDIKAYEANAKGTAYFDNVKLSYQWAPTHLRKTAQTDTSVSLEWDKPLYGDGYAYEVYRVNETGDGKGDEKIAETKSTSYTWKELYSPTNLKDAVLAYSFYVVAKPDGSSSPVSQPSNTLRIATQKPPNTISIMPVGDSLTLGYPIPPGYRGPLWELLQAERSDVLFVGSVKDNEAEKAGVDPDHEGHPGYTTEQIAEVVDSQVPVYAPDYVLLMAGTNYMMHYSNQAGHMKGMIERIADSLPDTYVITAAIPDIYLYDNTLIPLVRQYNEELKEVVRELREEGKKVGIVDMNSMVTSQYYQDPGNDDIHPNADGYKVMAEVWYDAIDAVINTGDVAGGIPTKPVLNEPALSADHSAVELSWQEASDNIGVDRYKIYVNDVEKASVTGATYGVVTNLAPSTTYYFSVAAVDKAGNQSVSDKVRIDTPAAIDLSPPSTPAGLTASDITHNGVTLSWTSSADDVGIREYRIGYGDSAVSVTNVVYDSDNRIRYELTGLSPETPYEFNVKAIDHAGNASEASEPVSIETMAAPPSGLRVEAKTTTGVTLTWNEATDKDGIAEYRIYRKDSPAVTTDRTSYSFEGLTPGQTYTFQVTAVDTKQNETLKSGSLDVKMELQAPLGLNMTQNTLRSIDIQWPPVGGATGYHVYLDGKRVATTTDTAYHAEGLTPDTKYSFAVQSIFGEGLESEIGAAIEFSTGKIPDSPPPGGGGGGGGGAAPSSSESAAKYETTDKGIKLTLVPDTEEALKSLNGTEARLAFDIPSDKPFDLLEFGLDGAVWKLAAEKQKPIVIRMGAVTLELPPGWLKVEEKDKLTFTIAKRSLDRDNVSSGQSLKPISNAFAITVQRNGEQVAELAKPARLSLSTTEKPDADLSGVYLLDNTKGTWVYLGGTVDAGGAAKVELSHFSEVAVLTSIKTFEDIASHWARKEIESLAARQIVTGVTSDRFDPAGEVTRAEFAVMLARALKLDTANERLPFEDLHEDDWYYDAIAAAYRAGWIQGVGGNRLAPADRITREEMAVLIEKAYAYAKGGTAGSNELIEELPFRDSAEVSEWAAESVRLATSQGLIQGIDGSFKPKLYADRAQAAVMIGRLLKSTD